MASPKSVRSEANQSEDFIGVLDVYIHQARDIHNICIYHKQDVYAKLCLTSDPENSVSTQIINGGGKNPVFNQNLSLHVRTPNSSLKCEIWMLSRVRNYLQDQLLGFTLVPITEVILKNGRLEKEFALSSTDLFHSPAGFVQVSLSYTGSSPDVISIPSLPTASAVEKPLETTNSVHCELDRIEFPDPVLVSENEIMVSQYFELSHANAEAGSKTSQKQGHCPSSFPADESHPSVPTSSQSPRMVAPSQDIRDGDRSSTRGPPGEPVFETLVGVDGDLEEEVVQQDIVELYMKSMRQFTECLAKMKLPMDLEREQSKSPNSDGDQKLQASKSPSSRVFYGSRAFF